VDSSLANGYFAGRVAKLKCELNAAIARDTADLVTFCLVKESYILGKAFKSSGGRPENPVHFATHTGVGVSLGSMLVRRPC
jgi:hypothetical protein